MIFYSTGNHVTSCGISGYSTGSDMTPTAGQKKIIEMIYIPERKIGRGESCVSTSPVRNQKYQIIIESVLLIFFRIPAPR